MCQELYHGTLDVCMENEVHKYHCMCETVNSWLLPLRHNSEYFVNYQNIILEKLTDSLKYGEHDQLDDSWRWVCWDHMDGYRCCKTNYIEKSNKHALP